MDWLKCPKTVCPVVTKKSILEILTAADANS